MATTANYGWTTPDDTDLVKDGASAIRTLGSAIDTTVYNNLGLVHINTTSFSAVASQQVNSVFSADYDNYRILLNITAVSSQDLLRLTFGTSGVLNTTSNYYRAVWRIEPNSSSVTNVNGTSPVANLFINEIKGSDSGAYEINLYYPFATQKTYMTSVGVDNLRSGAISNGFFNLTTSFTDFAIIKDAGGTMSGSVSVYGYKS